MGKNYGSALLISLILLIVTTTAFGETMTIRIEKKDRGNIYLEILEFLIESSEGELVLEQVELVSTQAREIELIRQGKLDLGHAGTSIAMERDLIPIRYPLLRGLSGLRLILANKSMDEILNRVRTVDDLSRYIGLQGIGWIDAEILNDAGLPQRELKWANIYPILDADRDAYHLFGVLETFHKYDQYELEKTSIIIHDKLAVSYPLRIFFFVNKDRTDIAKKLEEVFQKVYEDGSFLRFFYSHPYVSGSLERARLGEKHIISIPNPYLSEESENVSEELLHQW